MKNIFRIKKEKDTDLAIIEINSDEEYELVKSFFLKHNWRFSMAMTNQSDWDNKELRPKQFPFYIRCCKLDHGIYCNFISIWPPNIIDIGIVWKRVGYKAAEFESRFVYNLIYRSYTLS